MTLAPGWYLALGIAGIEAAVWLTYVPAIITPSTFLFLNALVVSMVSVGFGSAAQGLPPRSVTQLLHELENRPAR
jgi:hypothetical protein